MPSAYDLNVYAGDSGEWQFTFWEDPYRTVPVDLTGATWKAEVREKHGSVVVTTLTVSITDPNILTLTLSPTSSKLLVGTLSYDVEGTWPNDRVTTLLAGRVLVTPDITNSG
jgi:hypothetical protein